MNRMAERNKKIAGSKLNFSPGMEEVLAWAAQPAVGELADALGGIVPQAARCRAANMIEFDHRIWFKSFKMGK